MASLSVSSPASQKDFRIGGEDINTKKTTMSSSSAISEAVGAADLKREVVRESLEKVHSHCASLVLLTLQWKDLEDRYAAVERSIDQQKKELELESRQLGWKTKRLTRKSEIIDLREKELAEKCKEIDSTYQLVAQCYSKVLEKDKDLSRNLGEAESMRNRLESFLSSLERSERALESKDGEMRRRSEELDKREEELGIRKQSLDDRVVELTAREKKLNSIERELLKKIQDVEAQWQKFEESCGEMRKRQEDLLNRVALAEIREKKLDSLERGLLEKIQTFDSQQKKFEEEYKAFKEKERCVDGMLVELKDEKTDPSYADIRFYITMNERDLLQYLSGRVNEHETMRDEVTRALLLSANPAKLVLDAVHGFHPLDSENIDRGLGLDVVRRTCIFLLEQLTALDLKIIPEEEKERARLLAIEWKRKIRVGDCHQEHRVEIVGFLQLVASYRLVDKFNEDGLLKLLKMAGSRSLCVNLGLMDKIHEMATTRAEDRAVEEFDVIACHPTTDEATTPTEGPSGALSATGGLGYPNSKLKRSSNEGSLFRKYDGQKKKKKRKNTGNGINNGPQTQRFQNVKKNKPKGICYNCRRHGHFAKHCSQ